MISLNETIDKQKALSLLLHCADISHPSKTWHLHEKWTNLLVQEFFAQGDKEKELGLPFSPLCDRNNTHIAQSQIGFINFIVEPSMGVLGDMIDKIFEQIFQAEDLSRASKSEITDSVASGSDNTNASKKKPIERPWTKHLIENKNKWLALTESEKQTNLETATNNAPTSTSTQPTSPRNSNDGDNNNNNKEQNKNVENKEEH